MASSSQVESIFFAALEKKAGAERSAYLEQACGGDSALRLRVEQLLEAHPQAQDFLAEPAVDRDPFEVVAESFLARFRAGQRPSIEDLADRHADAGRPDPRAAAGPGDGRKGPDDRPRPRVQRPAGPSGPSPGRGAAAGRLPHPSRDRPGRDGGRLRGRAGQPGPPGGAQGPAQPGRGKTAWPWNGSAARRSRRRGCTTATSCRSTRSAATARWPTTRCSSSRARGSTRSSTSWRGCAIPGGSLEWRKAPGRPRPPRRPVRGSPRSAGSPSRS